MGTEHLKGVLSVLSDAKEGDILPINLTTPHPLYSKYAEIWGKCRDASDGEEAIKGIYDHQNAGYSSGGRTRQYLPKLNGQSQEEYANYLSRAHWFGASSRTIGAYLGMIYRKNPQVFYKKERETEIPDDFFNNISVEGASLTDFMHEVTEEIITVNRVGVLVDYPQNSEAQNATSAYEYEEIVKEKRLTPNVSMYKTETIVNWNWTYIDGKLIPMYFVLKEEVYNGIDMGSLAPVKTDIYRILFLEPYEKFYRYKQLVFESVVSGVVSNSNRVTEVITPQMNGKYIPFIPFYILDDKGINFKNIKKPMINDLVNVNVGHFRNSADWENELHIVGHKTLYFPGWDKKVYGNPKIGGALAGPANCEPKMIEASSDSGIRKEMDKKVEEMAVLGSEKISNASGFNTSVPAGRMATASESSTLTLLAGSLGRSFTVIGRFLLQWAGIEDTGINVQVNKDFFQDDITGAEVLEWMNLGTHTSIILKRKKCIQKIVMVNKRKRGLNSPLLISLVFPMRSTWIFLKSLISSLLMLQPQSHQVQVGRP